jgi:hypothetical protein
MLLVRTLSSTPGSEARLSVSRLFISHSSVNNAAAIALRDWLAEHGWDDVFLDIDPEHGLVAGQRWQEALKVAADRCEAVLFLVSPAWLKSRWCLAEFLLAKSLHKRIFGLIVEPVPLDQLPSEMTAEWQLCELVGEDRYRTFVVEVLGHPAQVAFREAGLDLLRRGLDAPVSTPVASRGRRAMSRTVPPIAASRRWSRRTPRSSSAATPGSCVGSTASVALPSAMSRRCWLFSAPRAAASRLSRARGCGRGCCVTT